jgi:hypothetical protein
VELGAVGVAFEVRLSKDLVPIVSYDSHLGPETHCDSCVSELTAAQIANCPVVDGPAPRETPPTLRAVLDAMNALPVQPLLLVVGRPDPEDGCGVASPENVDPAQDLGGRIGEIVNEAEATAFTAVEGREALLLSARDAAPGILPLTDAGSTRHELAMAETFKLGGMVVESKFLAMAPVGQALSRGILVLTWDVNTPTDIASAVAVDASLIETSRIRDVFDALTP